MAGGIPIRLIQENGNTIELDATTMVLSTSRKVGGSSLPFTGSKRIGMDLNINKATINIQGIIADDREGTKSTAYSGTINFGTTKSGLQFTTTKNLEKLYTHTGVIKLQTFDTAVSADEKEIRFTNVASRTDGGNTSDTTQYDANAGTGGTPTILVNASNATSVQLATAVRDYINAQYSSDFTATLQEGVNYNNESLNCIVNIAMTSLGKNSGMGISTPDFTHGKKPALEPSVTKFAGGTDGGKKSAGDKTMDLYGIINNSKRRGRVSDFINNSLLRNGRAQELKDYIVGIQIPYNSTLKATGGDQYVARNFFMPTGNYDGLDKTSEGNNLPASVDFSMKEETTGIQGSVQKFDITYDAGESVYNFNMIFAPIDNLILS